jgi:hypothetical protein
MLDLSLIALYKAIFLDKKSYWLLAGLLMGLAFDSKYTGVFLPPRAYIIPVNIGHLPQTFIFCLVLVICFDIYHYYISGNYLECTKQVCLFRFQTTSRVGEIGVSTLTLKIFLV